MTDIWQWFRETGSADIERAKAEVSD